MLPAVPTEDWHVDTLDQHISHVRNLYLHELGQSDQVKPEPEATEPEAAPPDDISEADLISSPKYSNGTAKINRPEA